VDPANAHLLPGDLDGALDTDDPVHGGTVRVGWWGRPGWSGTTHPGTRHS
jgi:hypothetical protein